MEQKKNHFMYLDILRLVSCIAVFLYHLNILKGGFLAVCSFFVLTAFLSCFTEFKKQKFSITSYYLSRLLKLYLPLVAVVFTTIGFLSLTPDILQPSIKPELKSILLGYNNFWQLTANLDYFAQHVDSPFMHLWYVSILLQFDLIFPLIFVPLRKLGDKLNKIVPCFITVFITIASCGLFYGISLNNNIMSTYYNTFSRMFSLCFGLSLGFIHHYYGPAIFKELKVKKIGIPVFTLYLTLLISLFFTIDATSPFFQASMILVSVMTCRLIDYSIVLQGNLQSLFSRFLKYLSSISYEFYLLQYPIIFYMQTLNIDNKLKYISIAISLLTLSIIYHYILSKNKNNLLIKYILKILLIISMIPGIRIFILANDNTKEMDELKSQLEQSKALIAAQQEEYNKNYKAKQEEFERALQEIDEDENKLADMITNIPAVAMGDSVMENNAKILYAKFPNIYIDALYLRQAYYATGALEKLKEQGKLGNPIILEFGANGDVPQDEKRKIMDICEGHDVFWLTVPNDRIVKVNDNLFKLAEEYPNLHIIDWYTITRPHPEYFISDKVHLNSTGKQAFAQVIYDSLYNFYQAELTTKKDALQQNYNNELEQMKKMLD